MGRQNADEVLFTLSYNITFAGKIWLVLTIFLRAPILLFAGYPLYQDEQERFICNIVQPGCSSSCYDAFSPFSLLRFWLVQLVVLCLPCAVFVVHVVHRVVSSLVVDTPAGSGRALRAWPEPQKFCCSRILCLLLQTLLEAGFPATQYCLFGLWVPKRFLCHEFPCTSMAECYISRPTEKTVMLSFMMGVSVLSLLLGITDLISTVKHSARRKRRSKRRKELKLSRSGCDQGESVCLEAAHPSLVPQTDPPSPETTCLAGDEEEEEEGLEQEGSEVALCLTRKPSWTPPPVRRKPSPSPKLARGPIANPTAAFCARRTDQCNLVEARLNPQSDRSETSDTRAWV